MFALTLLVAGIAAGYFAGVLAGHYRRPPATLYDLAAIREAMDRTRPRPTWTAPPRPSPFDWNDGA